MQRSHFAAVLAGGLAFASAARAASDSSPAVAAVAMGPGTAAPPSFDGHGWLFALNLTFFTAGFYLMLMLAVWLWLELRKYRGQDGPRDPITLWRRVGFFVAAGFCLRCGAEAFNLWSWDPRFVRSTATALTVKRFVDPIAFGLGGYGMGLFFLSLRSMTMQLRKRPLEVFMRPTLPLLKRPLAIVALSFVAAVGVVATR